MKIFCYGSNMSSERITERCSSSRFISRASVIGWKLLFNKRSKDGSGKANLVYTGDESLVWGVIFDITEDQKPILDKFEGLGWGYDELKLKVISDLGEEIECVCYIATDGKYLDNNLKPFDWYKEWCLKGAKQHNLPSEYILTIEKNNTL
jgi:gamma-glutamylcyclotransferase